MNCCALSLFANVEKHHAGVGHTKRFVKIACFVYSVGIALELDDIFLENPNDVR